jgi:hypothetical protein
MMKIEYIVLEDGVIQYVDGNKLVSIPPDPANSDYQAYLAAQSTPNEL